MDYSDLAEVYLLIESTTKRLEMTQYLVDLFQRTPPEFIDKIIYLTQGKIQPDYMGIELGVADKLALRAIAFTTGFSESEAEQKLIKIGDIGLLAEELVAKKKQTAGVLSTQGIIPADGGGRFCMLCRREEQATAASSSTLRVKAKHTSMT